MPGIMMTVRELPPFYEQRGYRAVKTAPFTSPRATRPCHFIIMSKSLVGVSTYTRGGDEGSL